MTPFFYNTIVNIRTNEELVLYNRLSNLLSEENSLVTDFLKNEYHTECLNYPFKPPPFDEKAALWSAKILYLTCQLILNRENDIEEIKKLLPFYQEEINASSILSADLCLRFLPQTLVETKHIDPDDELIDIVEKHLVQWHYSSIGYPLKIDSLNLNELSNNECLLQLYADRIILKKDKIRAENPLLLPKIKEIMGIYTDLFWKELNN